MVEPKTTTLFFAPASQYVEATIISPTPVAIQKGIHEEWWSDPDLRNVFDPKPIDRHWDWIETGIEYEGRSLPAERIAIVTGDSAIQGAMLISTQPVSSSLDRGAGSLFIELLFTAPRNRPKLRRDGLPYFLGVGTELLTWGAWLSAESGYAGRLMLDGSPEYLAWYKKRGLQTLVSNPILFEGTEYTPMELPPSMAKLLLKDWK